MFDETGRVFLVRHTYVSGWYMPGGGVDPGETAAEAIAREVREEGGIELLDPPVLFGVYFNEPPFEPRPCRASIAAAPSARHAPKTRDPEIAETGFFAPDALPEGTTAATRRRLDELAGGRDATPIGERGALLSAAPRSYATTASAAGFSRSRPCGAVEVLLRAERDDAGRVDRLVAGVVVALDVVEVHRLGDARRLVEFEHVSEEVRVVGDPPGDCT